MNLSWTDSALGDVERLFESLVAVSPPAAARFRTMILRAPEPLLRTPRLGAKVDRPGEEDVRRLLVGDYELRYLVSGNDILVLRVWHMREDR